MANYKQGGYEKKYIISKANGNPTDPNADYFVLRLDKDPHAQKALITYMESVRLDNEQFANDLEQKLINEYGLDKTKNMYTQGKWIARINDIGIDVVEEKTGFGIVDLGTEKTLKGEEYPIDEAKANAMLIAAAPDLLKAAIEMVNAGSEKDWEAAESIAIDKLHKAIEKARGNN